jgi:hypothetical protein
MKNDVIVDETKGDVREQEEGQLSCTTTRVYQHVLGGSLTACTDELVVAWRRAWMPFFLKKFILLIQKSIKTFLKFILLIQKNIKTLLIQKNIKTFLGSVWILVDNSYLLIISYFGSKQV